MAPNLALTASFVDVQRPTIAITAPIAGQRWSNSLFTITGKAGDNARVDQVFYRLNTRDWALASTTNGWTNWTAEVALAGGTNIVWAFAQDTAGNMSLTNSVSFGLPLLSSSLSVASQNVPSLRLLAQNHQLSLRLSGDSGRSYLIQSSTDLLDWQDVTILVPVRGAAQISQPISRNRIFYRAVATP
jgi:hypothetical protein